MSCIKAELIQKYIDKAASDAEIAMVDRHLTVCPGCSARVTELQRRSEKVRKALNLLVNDDIAVPGFIAPPGRSKIREVMQRKKLILRLSAASVLICVFLAVMFTLKTRTTQRIVAVHSVDREIDANRTITQQPMVINVIDADGKVTQLPFNVK
jgi:anti-sigma factor RsiW